ncbi:MAG: hypothetical protein Q7T16_04635 [Candidatus Burarchaeum sp.]|nr:hypothetical protein [Candidatus Burarchaeum sp.]MDO8339915.1 hypothetical protein [Candidatus Burarchaeum sp.]
MRIGILAIFAMMLLFAAAFAAETAAEAPAGAEAEQGISVGAGSQLIVIGVVATVLVFVIIYFLLSLRKHG